MNKAFLYIDGENFRYKIVEVLKQKGIKTDHKSILNIDFENLFKAALQGIRITKKFYYSAKLHMIEETKAKSTELIKVQRILKTKLEKEGFNFVISGNVRIHQVETTIIPRKQKFIFNEKGVDVRIAVDMVAAACDKKTTTVILCSSDSDLQPAIKEARKRGLEIIYLGFENAPNKGLTYTTNKTILFRNSEVIAAYKV